MSKSEKVVSAENSEESKAKSIEENIKSAKKHKKEKKPTDKLADKTAGTKFLQLIFGDPEKKTLSRLYKKVKEINKLEPKYEKMSDEELQDQTRVLKEKLSSLTKQAQAEVAKAKFEAEKAEKTEKSDKTDESLESAAEAEVVEKSGKKSKKKSLIKFSEDKVLDQLLPDAFALVRESTKRVLGMRHFDVQLIGGMALHEGTVAEMKTGEGKTLVALLPAYLNALSGKGVHVVTVNDYLAQRDAGWNGPVYDFLGLSVGVIIAEASFIYDKDYENEDHTDPRMKHLKPCTRKEAYNADVTYGTNNESVSTTSVTTW